jgi:hypothetical protein
MLASVREQVKVNVIVIVIVKVIVKNYIGLISDSSPSFSLCKDTTIFLGVVTIAADSCR